MFDWIGETITGVADAVLGYKSLKLALGWLERNPALAVLVLVALGLPVSLWGLHRSEGSRFTWRLNGIATVLALVVYLLLLGFVGVLMWRG